ncbi:MAG: hypothetical protein ACOVO3_07205 [Fluviicola sp.]
MNFTEKQTFKKGWMLLLILLLLGIAIAPWVVYFLQIETDIVGAIIGSTIGLLLTLLFLSFSLRTRIDASGIHYQYKPFHGSERHIDWSKITHVEVKEFSPFREYGGWGLKIRGFDMKDLLLNVSGKTGIYLTTNDGRKIMLGTQKAEEARKAIKQFGQKEEKSTDASSSVAQ